MKNSVADDRMKVMSGLRFIQKIALLATITAAFALPVFNLSAVSAAQTGDYFQNLQKQIDVLRNQIKEKEETFKKLQEQEKNLNNQIKTAQKKETTLKNQINQFDQRIQKLAVDIQITETKISRHQLRIRELNLEIKRSEEIIQRNKKNLAELVRTIRLYDQANLLEILLQNKNFSDFLNQTERVQQLQRETQKRLEEIKLAKLKLGGEKTETESEKAELERLDQELDGQKAAAENQKTEKENLLKITKNQEKNYQRLLSQVEKQQLEIQQGILDLEDKLRFAIDPSKIPAPRAGVLSRPQKGIMSQGYGPTSQTGFINDAYKFHNGIDIVGGFGTPIRAAKDGTVKAIGDNGKYAYGRWIAIEHENGLTTLYGHLSSQIVKPGQKVAAGQAIGYEGSTGFSTGSHLHFTVYATSTFRTEDRWFGLLPLGGSINPLNYL